MLNLKLSGILLGVMLFLITAALLCIHYPVYIALPVSLLAIPLLILVYAGVLPPFSTKFFTPIKIISAAFSVVVVPLMVLTIFSSKYIQIFAYVILILSMLEALVCDLKSKNILNALAGAVLALLIPFCFKVEWMGYYYIIMPHALIYWVIGYTLWNWNFILLNFSAEKSLYHVAVLLSPLCIILFTGVNLWLISRASTLFIGILLDCAVMQKAVYPSLRSATYFKIYQQVKTNKRIQTLLFVTILVLAGLTVVNSL